MMMHQRIMRHDATTHQLFFGGAQNAPMHQITRANIRKLMEENGIKSERQLAMECGIVQSTLNRFMGGETDSFDFINLQTVAHFFGLTVSQLIGETPFEEDRKVRVVALAMQQMPEYKKDMLVAASSALNHPDNAEPPKRISNGD